MSICISCGKSTLVDPQQSAAPSMLKCEDCGGKAPLDDVRNLWTGIANVFKIAGGILLIYGIVTALPHG